MVKIEELSFGKKDRKRFIDIEFRLNRDDPHWVPTLRADRMKYMDPERNPFFEHATVAHFVAVVDGRDVGRVAAVRNTRHEEFHDESVGFFGFFECPDDGEISKALLDAAAERVAKMGLEAIRGPISYDTNEISGALVEGFDMPPTLMMPYNRPYLPGLIEAAGFAKEMDLLAYVVPTNGLPDRIERISDRLKKREGIEIRSLVKKRLKEEVRTVRDIYNQAWERNWGFVPLTDAEMDYKADELAQVLEPELIMFAEVAGEPVGFAMCLPDANQALRVARSGRLFPTGLVRILLAWRKIDRVRVVTLGTIPEYRNRGVEVLFYRELFDRSFKMGYKSGECSWVLEDNEAMNKGIIACGARVEKRYRVYEKPVS